MRILLIAAMVVLTSCHSEIVHEMVTTSCAQESTRCTRSGDCCSLWCVNGYCERREP